MKAVILLDNNFIDSYMFIRAIVFQGGGKMAEFVTPLTQCDPIKLISIYNSNIFQFSRY